jgi:hypothetical protein
MAANHLNASEAMNIAAGGATKYLIEQACDDESHQHLPDRRFQSREPFEDFVETDHQ